MFDINWSISFYVNKDRLIDKQTYVYDTYYADKENKERIKSMEYKKKSKLWQPWK